MRRGRQSQPARFEREVARVCSVLGIGVEWFVPDPGGREMTFFRDIAMVGNADACIALFVEGEHMEGGTAHVVEKAQDARVPVYAYVWDERTMNYRRVGEFDPDDTWSGIMPRG